MFKDQKLTVFPGTVSEYIQRMSEKEDHMARLYDAKMRKEKQYQAFIASAQQSASKKPGKAKFIDPKKQKAAKEKKNKISRLGWHRSDGKHFATRVCAESTIERCWYCVLSVAMSRVRTALQTLKKLDEDYLRLPEEVQLAAKAKPLHFKFPSPDDVASSLRSITDGYTPVVRLTDAAVGYGRDISTAILSHLTLEVLYSCNCTAGWEWLVIGLMAGCRSA